MSLFGPCADCGVSADLRYKPDEAFADQTRPSVCNPCRMRREEQLLEHHDDGRDAAPILEERDGRE